jgi:elongation factor G
MVPQGDGSTIVEGHVPRAEIQRYALDLRSLTQARATFTAEFDHYEAVPAHMVQRIIGETKEAARA